MAGHTQTENEGILSLLEKDFIEPTTTLKVTKQEILELVQDRKVRVVSAVWDRGLLLSGIAKYIAEEAMKLGQYDAVIWIDFIRYSSSLRKLQMRIAEKLGVQLPSAKGRDAATAATEEEDDDEQKEEEKDENVVVQKEGARKILAKLLDRRLKLLLVLDCVRTNSIDLRELGIHPELLEDVKFVVMARSKTEQHSPGLKVDRWYDITLDPYLTVAYCVSEKLVTGARDVADSLRINHHITLEPTIILCCITYLLLMPTPEGRISEEELSRYYMGEGYIHSMVDGEDMNIGRASAITKALLKEIVDNGIFKFEHGTEAGPKDSFLQMDHYLWEELTGPQFGRKYRQKLRIATEIQEMIESNCERISLATKSIETLPPTPPSCPAVTTLLLFGNLEMKSIPDAFFEHMTRLRVLDLSCTALTSLPSSISCLRNCLRFIKLQNCPSLETLPHSFKHLESLQLLNLSNTPLSTMPDDSFEHMYNLRLIDLSHTKIRSLSSSISNCCKLEKLFLKCCQSLETLPPDVFRLEKLQVLDISGCTVLGLKDIPFIMIVNHTIFKFDQFGTEAENRDIYVRLDDYQGEALRRENILDEYQEQLGIASTPEGMIESNCKWVSLAMKNIETLPPTTPSCPGVTTLLLYGNLEMKSIPDDFFEHMTRLRVLDLSCTALTSLPSSISCLRNCLEFIKLQNCPSLETLPHSFKHLESLQLLDLSNTPLSTMPDDSFEHMYDLRLINLSHTKISSLSSISNCCKLEKLFLKCCQSLETLPPDVFRLEKLQVLDISGCTVLGLKDIPFIMPNLRVLNMSESSIQFSSLSLKGFLSLETIQLPTIKNLEFLDLSNTKIREFPCEICEMTFLKRLDLVNTRQLQRVQWEKIKWLPQVLNWDQCGCGYGYFEEGRGWLLRKTQPTSVNEGGGSFPLISVSNASIFKSLEASSPLWKNCFTQFYIRISPCSRQQQQQQQLNKVVVPDYASKGRFPYRRVYDRMKEKHATAPVRFRRYLEMDGVKSLNRVVWTGIKAIAGRTELLWLHDSDFLTSLTDLGLEDSEIVEECRIERCHTMHHIFDDRGINIHGLRRLWVFELLKLKTVYDGKFDFISLQHLSLWWCPNLTSLFEYWPKFPKLETLEIRYCPRLVCINEGTSGERAFPRLHTLCLWDLRKLECVINGYLPALKKLKVGRCPKLQELPILPPPTSNNGDPDAAQPIEIQGESKWCGNIEWAALGWERFGGTRRPINFKKVQSPRWFYNHYRK